MGVFQVKSAAVVAVIKAYVWTLMEKTQITMPWTATVQVEHIITGNAVEMILGRAGALWTDIAGKVSSFMQILIGMPICVSNVSMEG